MTKIDNTFSGGASPTHYCTICGALWRLWPGEIGWNLRSKECGPCCDNVPMGGQIEVMTYCYENRLQYQLGSPLAGGFFGGEMTIDGELYALIVAPKAHGEQMDLEYKREGLEVFDDTSSDDDGVQNMAGVCTPNYPAAQFCWNLDIEGHNDWYLPSRDELMMLWRNLGPRRKNTPELFRENAAEAFNTTWYWSSTEHAQYSGYAWVVGFYGGGQDYGNKDDDYAVRAVRRFKI